MSAGRLTSCNPVAPLELLFGEGSDRGLAPLSTSPTSPSLSLSDQHAPCQADANPPTKNQNHLQAPPVLRCLFPAGDRTRVQITRELLCTLCTGWNHVRGWGRVARRIPKWYHPQRCPASLLLSGAGAHVVLAVTVAVLCGAAAVACAVAGQEPGDCSHCPREGQHRVLWAPRGAVSASGHSMRSQAHRQLGPRRRSWGRAGGVDKTRQARRVGSPPGSV